MFQTYSTYEQWYHEVLRELIEYGTFKKDRTNVNTYSLYDLNYKHNLITEGFPLLGTRAFIPNQSITEMIGFSNGIIDNNWYVENGCPFWNHFAVKEDIFEKVRKEDYELADEYCSLMSNGESISPTSETYRSRKKQLNQLTLQEGYKLITDEGISLYKNKLIAKKGDLGPIYGYMWRKWPGLNGETIDQLANCIELLKKSQTSRRILINSWNPTYLPDPTIQPYENPIKGKMVLPPCHFSHIYHTDEIPKDERFRMLVSTMVDSNKIDLVNSSNFESLVDKYMLEYKIPKYYLDIYYVMRSNDIILGNPANMIGYAWLCVTTAKTLNMVPRYVSYHGCDVHIYSNHIEGAKEILRRWDEGESQKQRPNIILTNTHSNVWDYTNKDYIIEGYSSLDRIKFPIAV